jgi:hypothetical protein
VSDFVAFIETTNEWNLTSSHFKFTPEVFCLKIEKKTRANLYIPCKAMALSPKRVININGIETYWENHQPLILWQVQGQSWGCQVFCGGQGLADFGNMEGVNILNNRRWALFGRISIGM